MLNLKRCTDLFYSSIVFITLILLHSSPGISQAQFWQQTNGPFGGVYVNEIFITPQDEIFLGTDLSGVYYSNNKGSTWNNIGLVGEYVWSVKIHPNGDLYAGIGGGIYRSSDMGNNWVEVLSLGTAVAKIAINSKGDIFAGAGLQDYPTEDGRLFRSIDNGLTWERKENGLRGQRVRDILILENDDIFLGVTGEMINQYSGVYFSRDNGESWQQVLSNVIVNSLCLANTGEIFASAGSDGVFCTSDSGKYWNHLSNGLDNIYVYCVTCTFNNDIFAGTRSGIFKLIDSTWVHSNSGFDQYRAYTLASDSFGTLYAGTTNAGVFFSNDNGKTWLSLNSGIIGTYINALLSQNGRIFAGTYSNGLFYSDDKGQSWIQSALSNMHIYSINTNTQGVIFVGTSGGKGIFRSFDNGFSWENIGLKNTIINSILPLFNSEVLTGTYDGIYKSENNGDIWSQIAFPGGVVRNLTVSPKGKIFARLYLHGDKFLIESNDFGNSWQKSEFDGYPLTIVVNNRGDIFLGGFDQNIFRSTDNGTTWEEIIISDDSFYTSAIICNSVNEIYVGTTKGIYFSEDNGDSWTQLNNGLGRKSVISLDFDSDGYLYAGTESNGVFRSVDTIDIDDNYSSQIVFDQNFPNPFNSETTIHLFLSNQSFVSLKIYDLFGREIATLVDQELSSGHHKFDWDASNLPSNIYFYQVKSGNFTETKKMIFIK